jgi:hypothetical protein
MLAIVPRTIVSGEELERGDVVAAAVPVAPAAAESAAPELFELPRVEQPKADAIVSVAAMIAVNRVGRMGVVLAVEEEVPASVET